MIDVRLLVGGMRYGGWKSIRVVRTIEAAAGSFDLEVHDRWAGQRKPWPIAEGDPCSVVIDDEVVIDGYVGGRSIEFSATSHSLSYRGRDRAAQLVDSSVVLDRWEFTGVSLLELARQLAAPFGVAVSLQPGLVLPVPPGRFDVSPGDTAFQVIAQAAQAAGVLVVSDGRGGLVLTRAGASRAEVALVEGRNILAGSVDYDADARFYRYVIATQVEGSDTASGDVTRVEAEAVDAEVARTERVLLVRPEAGITADYARRRAAWEARTRAAQAEAVTIVVRGWQQYPDGPLWPVNALVAVGSPTLGIDGELLIATADYSVDGQGGEVTQLRLVRPDAFDPAPAIETAPVIKKGSSSSGSRGWKELAKGV